MDYAFGDTAKNCLPSPRFQRSLPMFLFLNVYNFTLKFAYHLELIFVQALRCRERCFLLFCLGRPAAPAHLLKGYPSIKLPVAPLSKYQLDKNTELLGLEGNFLNMLKSIYEKPTANIMLSGERLFP